jgi:glucose-6-phosphate dehydrogenase assembly protein OpcA
VPLKRRPVRECLAEELRRLDADEIYQASLEALVEIESKPSQRRNGGGRRASEAGG